MANNKEISHRKLLNNAVLLLLGIFIVLVIFHYSKLSFNDLIQRLKEIAIWYYLIIFLLITLTISFVSNRWSLIVKYILPDHIFPRGFFFNYTSISYLASIFIFNLFGYSGVKIIALKIEKNVILMKGLYTVFIEHLWRFLVILIMTIPTLFFVFELIQTNLIPALNIILIIVSFYALIRHYNLMIKISLRLIKLFLKIVNNISLLSINKIAKIIQSETLSATLFSIKRKDFTRMLFYSFMIYIIELLKCYILAQALDIKVELLPFFMCYPLVVIISIIGITPGSLGITELGWIGVLAFQGIDKELATTFAISKRVIDETMLLLISLLGYIYYIYYKKLPRKNKAI